MTIIKFVFLFFLSTGLISCALISGKSDRINSTRGITRDDVTGVITRVNDYWQQKQPGHGNAFWHTSVYHIGNMAAFEVTGLQKYRDYSEQWATINNWSGARSDNRENWKYHYGETDDFVLFGDWQVCFQVYADLYKLRPDPVRIARAIEVMDYQVTTPVNDYLWWADGLFMVMPVMTRLYQITGNQLYLDKLYDYFAFARDLMYDRNSSLFFRDARYVYPEHKTQSGLKDFWSRGNGWVFAAFPMVLDDLPVICPHRDEYIYIYRNMAYALLKSQQDGGYWTRSLLDPAQAPGPESSGTSFFIYGMLWGINNNILDRATFLPAVEKGWRFLVNNALQPSGRLGYVQPIGERAIPGQIIDINSTADFGVGAFLLAASEMARFVDNN